MTEMTLRHLFLPNHGHQDEVPPPYDLLGTYMLYRLPPTTVTKAQEEIVERKMR